MTFAAISSCGVFFHAEAEGDVVEDVHVWEEAVLLEDHAYLALARLGVGDVFAVKEYFSSADVFKTGEAAQQGALAAARRPEKRNEVAALYIKVYPLQDHVVSEFFDYVLKFYITHYFLTSPAEASAFDLKQNTAAEISSVTTKSTIITALVSWPEINIFFRRYICAVE